MLEQELVALIRVLRRTEAGELPHCPQLPAIPSRVHAAGVRVDAGHTKRIGAGLSGVERSVEGLDFSFGIGERYVAQLTAFILPAPFRDFLAQQAQLGALLLDRGFELAFSW